MAKTETTQKYYNDKGELISEVTTTSVTVTPSIDDATLKTGMYL